MLVVKTLSVGDLEANCYLVSNLNECLVIDPGDDADFITETIANEKLTPTAIVLTHGHFDHVLGCLELKLNFDIPIMLHKNDLKLYSSANQIAKHWLKKKTLKVPPIDQFIKEGDKIKVGSEALTVLETPGHTPGSICLLSDFPSPYPRRGGTPLSGVGEGLTQTSILFTGDTLFKDAVGRTDLSYSSPSDLQNSLLKLKSLLSKYQIMIYPGHGEPTTLAAFFAQNFIGQPENL